MRAAVALPLLLVAAACTDERSAEVREGDERASALDAGAEAGDSSVSQPDAAGDSRSSARPAPDGAQAAGEQPSELRLRADVEPVTSSDQAKKGVFIPPFRTCTEPKGDDRGAGPDGKVCTNVAISGATEEGKRFADYADCSVVISQRPFWSAPPARESAPDDPRLEDEAYLEELGWVAAQVAASGCVCCHDSKVLGKQASQWDISLGPLWLDSLSDSGLALFAGLADSSVLGAYPPADNFGFDRNVVGIPTTDNARMERFMFAELARRGISEEQARAVPPFGGPIYENRVAKPIACKPGEGVDSEGRVQWLGGGARYVYVMEEGSENPGVPPNLDLPEGTIFRLDVLASEEPVAPGFAYGTTPAGSFQAYPESDRAAALTNGKTYHLTVLRDVGIPLANCLFEFGAVAAPVVTTNGDGGVVTSGGVDAGSGASGDAAASGACTLAGGDTRGFGAPCSDGVTHSDCTCEASFCAVMPGQSTGYCTKRDCTMPANACPDGWSCFDLSRFAPDQPAICTQ